MKISNEEYKEIIKELIERAKDTMFIGHPSKEIMEILGDKDDFTFSITFVGGDIMQILGNIRRKKCRGW